MFCAFVYLARWEKYVKMYIVVMTVVGTDSNSQFHFGSKVTEFFDLH